MGLFDSKSSKEDEVQDQANYSGHNLYVGTDGFLRSDPQETVSSNMGSEGDYSRGASGNCTQDPNNVPTDDK